MILPNKKCTYIRYQLLLVIGFALTLITCSKNPEKSKIIINANSVVEIRNINKDTTKIFKTLKNQSKVSNKNLFIIFGFEACAFCRMFERYHNDSLVKNILNKYIIVADIDINLTPGGKELYKKYGKIGFPSWVILDSSGNVIADSEDRESGCSNVGYPDRNTELNYYLNSLKKAAPSITSSECNTLKSKLKSFRN